MDEIACCNDEGFAKPLAHETRHAILELLREREMSAWEMAACFEQTQPTISYHLGLLRHAGLLVARRKGKQVYYTVNRCCLEKCTRRLVKPLLREHTAYRAARQGE